MKMDTMDSRNHQYIVDSEGNRTHVIISVEDYDSLKSQIDDLPSHPSERNAPSSSEEVFTYTLPRKGAHARGLWRYPTMLVLKGSTVAEPVVDAMPQEYQRIRQNIIDIGVIQRIADKLTFTRDYEFSNPSVAVCVIEGGSRDGYRSWKDSHGSTISQLGYSR